MDGITAAERICLVANILIVFLTAFSQDPLLQRAKAIAPYGYLIKPLSLRELTATIEIAFYKHSLSAPRLPVKALQAICLPIVALVL